MMGDESKNIDNSVGERHRERSKIIVMKVPLLYMLFKC